MQEVEKTTRTLVRQDRVDRRMEIMEGLAFKRQVMRLTIKECAQELGVSARTVQNYLGDPAYREVITRLRAEWREGAITTIAGLSQMALQTMRDLMQPGTKSEHVRFLAAKQIGDWFGLGQQMREEAEDDRGELDRLQRLLAETASAPTFNIFAQTVQPGGFLPVNLQRSLTAALPERAGVEKDTNSSVSECDDEMDKARS